MPRSRSTPSARRRTIFERPDGEQVWAQHARVVQQLDSRFPEVAAMLIDQDRSPPRQSSVAEL